MAIATHPFLIDKIEQLVVSVQSLPFRRLRKYFRGQTDPFPPAANGAFSGERRLNDNLLSNACLSLTH
jgi:hypothetical protein